MFFRPVMGLASFLTEHLDYQKNQSCNARIASSKMVAVLAYGCNMPRSLDFNQLLTLEILLEEQSVVRAARRLNTSPATISRALARIRDDFGDAILVASGRGLAPTQYALDLLPRVHGVLESARGLYDAAPMPDLSAMTPRFTLVLAEAVIEAYGTSLADAIWKQCPGATIHFLDEVPLQENERLRRGEVDLYVGVFGTIGPEIMRQTVRSGFTKGAVRDDHPLLSGPLEISRIFKYGHIMVSRDSNMRQPIDDVLASYGSSKRRIELVVPTYAIALAMLRKTDLILGLPDFLMSGPYIGKHKVGFLSDPTPTAPFDIFQAWHPRLGKDPVHRWLRETVQKVIAQ